MSVKDELLESGKLDARLLSQIDDLLDDTDPDQGLFSLFVHTSENAVLPGVNNIVGTIRTAHNVSLNGLKALVDHKDVFHLSGGSPMRPQNTPGGPRMG